MLWINIFWIKTQLHISGNKTGPRNHLYDWLRYPSGMSRCQHSANQSWTCETDTIGYETHLINEYPMRSFEKLVFTVYTTWRVKLISLCQEGFMHLSHYIWFFKCHKFFVLQPCIYNFYLIEWNLSGKYNIKIEKWYYNTCYVR